MRASERENYLLPTGCICKAARLKETRGCMCSDAAICLGDESSCKPDAGRCRLRIAVLSPLKTTPLKTKHTHTPADDHGSDDWLPSGVQEGAAGGMLGGDDDPQRSQTHEEGANQRRHVRIGIYRRNTGVRISSSVFRQLFQLEMAQ